MRTPVNTAMRPMAIHVVRSRWANHGKLTGIGIAAAAKGGSAVFKLCATVIEPDVPRYSPGFVPVPHGRSHATAPFVALPPPPDCFLAIVAHSLPRTPPPRRCRRP